MATSTNPHPYEVLTPDFVMDAIESLGYLCDGRLFPLNSYENRVYQVGIEDQQPIIAKFYRPGRWTDEQILEEHQFCFELAEQELPVVAPMAREGQSLFHYSSKQAAQEQVFSFSLFERKGGHAPELDNLDNLLILGRLLGRFHLIGAQRPFQSRPTIDSQSFGHDSAAFISEHFIPGELKTAYDSLTRDILLLIDEQLTAYGEITQLRVHGDCHVGNILWRDDNPHFVDFDDARKAPAIQDIWMLLSGDRHNQTLQLSEIVEGYNEFYDFNPRELQLIEVLRTLRIMNYSAWLSRRWQDPAFPLNFPWFNTVRYWSEHILELREQFAALQEPPLQLQ